MPLPLDPPQFLDPHEATNPLSDALAYVGEYLTQERVDYILSNGQTEDAQIEQLMSEAYVSLMSSEDEEISDAYQTGVSLDDGW